jgi:16S rRNA (guanine527-N7)-methyltransferase
VLESLLLLEHLPHGAKIADIGSGAGLPTIPCLIARPDLDATLIESSPKKTVFLREALSAVGRKATIVAQRFEDIKALDWAPDGSTLLLFGGEELLDAERLLIPGSEKRYLFKVRN